MGVNGVKFAIHFGGVSENGFGLHPSPDGGGRSHFRGRKYRFSCQRIKNYSNLAYRFSLFGRIGSKWPTSQRRKQPKFTTPRMSRSILANTWNKEDLPTPGRALVEWKGGNYPGSQDTLQLVKFTASQHQTFYGYRGHTKAQKIGIQSIPVRIPSREYNRCMRRAIRIDY